MESPCTRLVHLLSGRIEPFPIGQMPPYVAISHTWADNLFPPGISYHETAGSKSLEWIFTSDIKEIQHGWIDTLCIDQNDPEDKQRQIPLMGDIYGNAQVVVIVAGECLGGLSQAEIDVMAESVQGAIEMSETGSWLQDGKQWTSSEKHRRKLKRAMDCLEIFTRPAWGSRVWTMQEFILAKRTIWVGGDLRPLRVDERLFQAIPDVCDYLAIEECLVPKYSKLYSHFQGMAGAHLKKIESTRVMELLGNRTATVPEDEIYGLMAASGVVLHQTNVTGKEKVWTLWWERAIETGHLRWALFPPSTTPDPLDASRNCIMPPYSVRHLASANSVLDAVQPYGPVEVSRGVVSMVGRLAGRCQISRKLGRIHINEDGTAVRDVTLVFFANNNWTIALRLVAAFGAGRYSTKQRAMIAQVLHFNYYRAKLAVLERRANSFRPRFRNQRQEIVWADFMLLQSTQMRVMNESLAFLAKISNDRKATDIVVLTDGEILTTGGDDLWAIDFGAINDSEKTMFTILRGGGGGPHDISSVNLSSSSSLDPDSPSLHRAGVSMYAQVTDDTTQAIEYECHLIDSATTNFESFRVGGTKCPVCHSSSSSSTDDVARERESPLDSTTKAVVAHTEESSLFLASSRHHMRLKMRRQNRALRFGYNTSRRVQRRRRAAHSLRVQKRLRNRN